MNAINIDSVSALQAALVRQRVDTAVLAKTRQVADEQAQAVLSLLDAAAQATNQADAPTNAAGSAAGAQAASDAGTASAGTGGHHVDVTV